MVDKEYTEATAANDTNYGYKELVEAVRFLKTTCENQVEINEILKDEIVQLMKESEMHKKLIKNLFEQVVALVTTTLPDVPIDVWNKLVEKTKGLGAYMADCMMA